MSLIQSRANVLSAQSHKNRVGLGSGTFHRGMGLAPFAASQRKPSSHPNTVNHPFTILPLAFVIDLSRTEWGIRSGASIEPDTVRKT